MPKRTIFEDAGDEFHVVETGALVMEFGADEERVIVSPSCIRDFHAWLGEEIARLDAEDANNG